MKKTINLKLIAILLISLIGFICYSQDYKVYYPMRDKKDSVTNNLSHPEIAVLVKKDKHKNGVINSVSNNIVHLVKKDKPDTVSYKQLLDDSLKSAYTNIADAYEKKGDKNSQVKYLKLSNSLGDSLNLKLKTDFKNSVEQITTAKDKKYNKDIKKIWIIAICGIILIAIILGLLLIRHIKKTKNRYEAIIKNFKKSTNIPIPPTEEQIGLQKEINIEKNKPAEITEATVKSILALLDEFEKTNEFIKNDVNLSYLAHYANTNTKYINEILKKYKGKSFSKYINGLRINYIMKLLYLEPKYREYKISYLAELCGFSSREVFSSVFKKETDITTSYYINQLRNEPETVVDRLD
ncbi:hypothetical protein GCM10023210_10080 [Chryseobacterium ginsengisoli]|uniref:HTH araC/xylS-type domain-containing protein n=1 Tax=Chryseobacterium ginsengisoli TaxID=363853 RepID=A0ABP9M140_9FLAO